MPKQTRDPDLLAAAILGLETRKAYLERQIEKVRQMLGSPASPRKAAPASDAGRQRELSEEGRKRIAEAARKRWAEYRKNKGKS
jgi:hypothetical protein